MVRAEILQIRCRINNYLYDISIDNSTELGKCADSYEILIAILFGHVNTASTTYT